jgi:hypothetical protein
MQKQTKSILEELETLHSERYADRDSQYILETRAQNVIAVAARLIEQIEQSYGPAESEVLTRKLINAIRDQDATKFIRSVRRTHANKTP